MKKLIKYIFIVFLLFVIGFSIIFHNRIALYISIVKKVTNIKNTLSQSTYSDILEPSEGKDSYTFNNINYTNNSNATLDLYAPTKEKRKSSPVIIYVHGGSWLYGDNTIPNTIMPLLDAFREEGYYILSVDYSLNSQNFIFDKQVSDIKDSIRWIYKNKDSYNFNTDEIGMIGLSAGAHLSLLAAYSNNTDFIGDKELSSYSSKIKYIIDFFGPTDLSTFSNKSLDSDFSNILKGIKNKEEMIEKYSPINYVSSNLPKTLIIHSKKDDLVPYENAENLYNKSISYKNKVKLVTLEEVSHDMSNLDIDTIKKISINIFNFLVNNSPL